MSKPVKNLFSGSVVTDGSWADGARFVNELQDRAKTELGWNISLVNSIEEANAHGGKASIHDYEARKLRIKYAGFRIVVADKTIPQDDIPWSKADLDDGRVLIRFVLTQTYQGETRVLGVRVGKPTLPGFDIAKWYANSLERWAAERSDDSESGWIGG